MLAWNCEACVANPRGFTATTYLYSSAKNTAGFVGYFTADPSTAVVSFRGTLPSSLQDWIDDLNFIKTDCASPRAVTLRVAPPPTCDLGSHVCDTQTTCATVVRYTRASTSPTHRCGRSCWAPWRS